jgi:crossover junction endodeoxyribonuclease RuvC
MIILGLDPGYAIIGYGIIEKTGSKITPISYGAITTKANTPLASRLSNINHDIKKLLSKYTIEQVAIEDLFFNKNTKTAMAVAQARGVLVTAAYDACKKVYSYTPPEIKSGVTGYGQATKSQIQYMVTKLLNLPSPPKPDDTADALAVAICHANSHKLKYITMQSSSK